MSFDVLVVCTGNICRSPTAARLMQAWMRPDVDVEVRSAGTRAVVGHPMDAASALALRELGGDPTGHVATQLELDAVKNASLVLTAATQHKSAVIQAVPAAMRRTFTLREFARLGGALDGPPDDDLATRVREVAARRGLLDAPHPGADEIADPIGAPMEQVRASAVQTGAAVGAIMSILGLRDPRTVPGLPG